MIVLDANVIIAYLDGKDAHHQRAEELLAREIDDDFGSTLEALREQREGLAPLPKLLSTTQAAEALGMTRQGIAAAIKAGNLQAIPDPTLAAYANSLRP